MSSSRLPLIDLPRPAELPLPGHVVAGHYYLVRQLGAGGMGIVFEAHDMITEQTVAVKLLAGRHARAEGMADRFLREAHAAERLDHPNVIRVLDAGSDEGASYLVMEYLPGGNVDELVERKGRLPWQQAVKLIIQAARGLAAAHYAGLIHRDVKPANLLLDAEGNVKVCDFGLVKLIGEPGFSQNSGVLGTPAYMSPEQCKGESLDERSDVYSLTATLYTLLTGEPLYDADNPYAWLYAHCSAPMPDPRRVVPDLPAAVVRVVQRGLARARAARFANMAALITALERLVGVRGETPARPQASLCRRAALAAMVGLGVFGVSP